MDNLPPLRNSLTMTCPVCHVGLQPTGRQGIEIDFCPQCRGVWLDRGELDKIIDRESQMAARGYEHPAYDRPAAPDRPVYERTPQDRPDAGYRRPYDRDHDDDDDDHRRGYGQRKRRGGFLGELFDFD